MRWAEVKSEHTISWSIQSHKKSLNFGIFRHPGSGNAPTPRLPSATYEGPPTPGLKPSDALSDATVSQSTSSGAVEKLLGIGLKLVNWYGTCDANLVTTGKHDVPKGEGGMYALVFDNTFSKQTSKTATFALLTYPTNAAPQTSHHVHYIQGSAASSAANVSKANRSRPKLKTSRMSSDSVSDRSTSAGPSAGPRDPSDYSTSLASATYHTGVLQKRRRRRHQGYARRFFSLDFATATLSYYHDRTSLTIRGSVPLAVAAIATKPATREISIDSGAEVWHLKAINKKDFEVWREALDRASRTQAISVTETRFEGLRRAPTSHRLDPEEERDWEKVDALISRMSVCRDMARNLAKDTDPKYLPLATSHRPDLMNGTGRQRYPSSSEVSLAEPGAGDESRERRPFWKRAVSGSKATAGGRSPSGQGISPNRTGPPPLSERGRPYQLPASLLSEGGAHEQCMDLLKNLDAVVAEFSGTLAELRQRRSQGPPPLESRMSMETTGSQDFYDAEQGDGSQLLVIRESEAEEIPDEAESAPGDHEDSSSVSDSGGPEGLDSSSVLGKGDDSIFPPRPKNLDLSTGKMVVRRTKIRAPSMSPPSLIGFLRKNVGKDLSAISMPVSANEPISLLQKSAEALEYSHLLDQAADPGLSSTERLLFVTAFAISALSGFRVKERAIRKPFNPMLGETYELVREDRGFRFVGEKISHRPVRLACQADAEKWSLSHSPCPTQKFWGKSAELVTEGTVRIVLHAVGERYVYTPATCALRNLLAGEKYVEPTGALTVRNFDSGLSAVATFKAKGLFGGRSEEVEAQTFDRAGRVQPLGLVGSWTHALRLTDEGAPRPRPIWTAGELVTDAANCYGFPTFAAGLNELPTARAERARLPPSDSRLRPDQRAVEDGDVDRAERFKARLEDAQRDRRRFMEDEGTPWRPVWFAKTEGGDGEEFWMLKGRDGYWEARAKGNWEDVPRVFDVE